MKNLQELFTLELKNIYALEKQIQETFNDIKSIKNDKLKKRVEKFVMSNTIHFIKIQALLHKNSINPGNTVDSVAKEILENLNTIHNSELKEPLKDAGFGASLNRLANYKKVNYTNVYYLAKALKMKKNKKEIKKDCKTI